MGRKKKIDKEVRKQVGILIHTVKLQCKQCKRKMVITVNNPEIYTQEVRKNWICLLCKR